MTEQQIQAYVMGELPPAEAAAAAAAIARDPELARLAEQYEVIKEGFRQERVAQLQQKLLNYEQTLPSPPQPTPKPPGKKGFGYWPYLLLVALLLSGTIFFFIRRQAYQDAAIADRYFQFPPNPTVAGNIGQTRATYNRAIEHFYEERYAAASVQFEELLLSPDFSKTAILFLPHTSYLLDNHQAAAAEFIRGINDKDFSPEDLQLLSWNKLMNDLSLGQDISVGLDQQWSASYPVGALKKDLNSFWR